MVVLDASAALALLYLEPGQETVRGALQAGAMISAVNLAEVVTRLTRNGMPADHAAAAVLGLPLEVHEFDEALAIETGRLTALTRSFGLSLGDRACLALAKHEGRPALTGDRAWLQAGPLVGVEVRLIR